MASLEEMHKKWEKETKSWDGKFKPEDFPNLHNLNADADDIENDLSDALNLLEDCLEVLELVVESPRKRKKKVSISAESVKQVKKVSRDITDFLNMYMLDERK